MHEYSEEPLPTAGLPNGNRIYAYAKPGGGFGYKEGSREIGQFKAFLIGLPSVWSQRLFVAILVMLPAAFCLPAMVVLLTRLRRGPPKSRPRLSLYYRCMSVMLAYVMLVSPMALQQTAQGATQYASLDTADWSAGDRTIEYDYDANGSMKSKTTKETSSEKILETITYEYNLQNRLAKVTVTPHDAGGNPLTPTTVTEYKYDPDGNRVYKSVNNETDDNFEYEYLIDSYNHTGYAQVFEETKVTHPMAGGDPTVEQTCYIIGDDVLAQVTGGDADSLQYLLYDGHGSTRQLVDSTGAAVSEKYSYDAYGVMLRSNDTPAVPATNLLYSGEQWDNSAQSYYLRARYYDPLNGRFNRTDPYAGSPQDPQSLHKYLYCHANPVNGIDPSGRMTVTEVTVAIGIMLFAMAGIHAICHTAKHRMQEKVESIRGAEAITFLGSGLQEQMNRDLLATRDPEVLKYNMEFWHEKAGMNKAVTLYNALAEKRFVQAIDHGYHALELADIGLAGAGIFVTATSAAPKIVWGTTKVHGTPDHMQSIVKQALVNQFDPDAKNIYVHKHLSDILGQRVSGTDYIPDIATELFSGKYNIVEYRSPRSLSGNLLNDHNF